MNEIEILPIIFLLLFFHAKAQDKPETPQHELNPLHPKLAVVIGILIVMFTLSFIVLAYAKFCNRGHASGQNDNNAGGLLRSRSNASGIDKKVIESLPFFRFSSLKGSKEGLECAVCLSKFEETETLRLLPKCRHAFHMNCIDEWLVEHSSCPLCRYKFDVVDLTSFTYSNSLRYPQNYPNLTEGPNLELYVEREQENNQKLSRFDIGSSFRKFERSIKRWELLIQDDNSSTTHEDCKMLHKFKHKIIVSDIVQKSRWSDVNSSDLMFLNSEMLNVMSSKRFSPLASRSERFDKAFSTNEQVEKVKEDMDRKRLYESKLSNLVRSNSVSTSSSLVMNPGEKRSMSEITNLSRFRQFNTRNWMKDSLFSGNHSKDEKMRRMWLPIARRTVQWLAGRERNSLQSEESKLQPSNV